MRFMPKGSAQYYKKIHGWFDYEAVYDQAVEDAYETIPSVFVEVGSWLGRSACYMAELIQISGKPITLYCVDHFEGSEEHKKFLSRKDISLHDQFIENITKGGFTDVIKTISEQSVFASRHYFNFDSIDFCFIDASHDYHSVKEDILAWRPKVKQGGILAGHDYSNAHPGVIKAVNEMVPNFHTIGSVWRTQL